VWTALLLLRTFKKKKKNSKIMMGQYFRNQELAFTLQAYDAARAVALGFEGNPYSRSSVDKMNGEELLEKIIIEQRLAPVHIFAQLIWLEKSYRELGYLTEGLGFLERIHKRSNYKKSMSILGRVFWPGGPWSVPKGWGMPTS